MLIASTAIAICFLMPPLKHEMLLLHHQFENKKMLEGKKYLDDWANKILEKSKQIPKLPKEQQEEAKKALQEELEQFNRATERIWKLPPNSIPRPNIVPQPGNTAPMKE